MFQCIIILFGLHLQVKENIWVFYFYASFENPIPSDKLLFDQLIFWTYKEYGMTWHDMALHDLTWRHVMSYYIKIRYQDQRWCKTMRELQIQNNGRTIYENNERTIDVKQWEKYCI